ncbi:Haze protective factor 1 [Streptomyces sp. NPDC097619]|uniref:Haze protective factor 1 n=1 Tax=Streptomyces sp. NPDC097619 TaxID=3157228 RepID=UPI0033230F85
MTVSVQNSIFGIDEERLDDEPERPFWLDLPMDDEAVRVGPGILRIMSNAQSHDAEVTLSLQQGAQKEVTPDYTFLGRWDFKTGSGTMFVHDLDGPLEEFSLPSDSVLEVRVWRKGGEDAAERYNQSLGQEFPIHDLESYRIVFS